MKNLKRIASATIALMLFVSGPFSTLNPETHALSVVKSSAEIMKNTYHLKIRDIVLESGEEVGSLKKVSDYKEAYENGTLSYGLTGKSDLRVVEVPVDISSQTGFNDATLDFVLDQELTLVGYKSDENGLADTLKNCSVTRDGTHVNIKGDNNGCVTDNGTLVTLLVALPDNYCPDKSYEVGINEETIQVSMPEVSSDASVYKIETGNITVRSAYILEIEKTVKNYDSLKTAAEYSNIYTNTDMSEIKPEYQEYKDNKVIEVPVNMLVNSGINTGSIKLKCDTDLTFIGCLTDENGKIVTLDTTLECGVNTKKLLINNDGGTECTKTGKLATLLFILPDNVKSNYKYGISFKKNGFNFVANQTLVSGIDGYAMVKFSKPDDPSEPEPEDPGNYKDPDFVLQIEKTVKNYKTLKNVSEYTNVYNGEMSENNIKPEYEEYINNKVIEVPLNMLVNSGVNTGTIKLECDEDLIFIGCLSDKNGKLTTLDTTLEYGVNTQKLLINNDAGTMCTKTGKLATLLFILPEDVEMDHEYNINFKKNGFNFVSENNKINGINGYAMVTLSDTPSTTQPDVTTAQPDVTTTQPDVTTVESDITKTTENTVTSGTQIDTDADYVLQIEKTEKNYNSLKTVSQYRNVYKGGYITGGNMKEEYIPYQKNKVIEVPVNMLVNSGISTGIISFKCDPELKFMGCLTNQDGAIVTLDTTINCGINAQKILFNSDQGKDCLKTGTLATLLFILPDDIKMDYKYDVSFAENGFDFVTAKTKIQGINGYAMVTENSEVTTAKQQETQNPETENTEDEKNFDFVVEIEKTEKNYDSLKCASEYNNLYNGEISAQNIKPEYEEYKDNKVVEVPVNMLKNAGINTGTIKLDFDEDLIFIGCLTDKTGKIMTLDTTLECGVNTRKLLINNDGGTMCTKTGTLATLLFILPENTKMDYIYKINFKKDGFNFVANSNKVKGINGYAMITSDAPVTTGPETPENPTTDTTENDKNADFVLEIEKAEKKYSSLKKASEYRNIYNGEISAKNMKPEYEEYKDNKVIEVPVNMLKNAGINTATIKLECDNDLIFIGCLTDNDGKIKTLDTTLGCGVNTKKLLINNDAGVNCVKTGKLATLLFILPEDVKMDYQYKVNFKKNGFNFVTPNNKVSGINGYAMVTDGFEETTVSSQTTDQPSTSVSQNYGDADYVLEIEKTVKNYNSLKKASEYRNVYTGSNIAEGKMKAEYEEYKNNKVIEVPMNILVNSGITAGIISFNCAPELKFMGCLTNENGSVITLDTSISCGINAQKILFNSDKNDKCVKTGTLATLLFILPEDVKMDYKYDVSFEENGFDFVANKQTILGIDGYAMVTLNNNVTDPADVTKVVTVTESAVDQTSIYTNTDKTGTDVNTNTDKTGTDVTASTDKTGTKVTADTDKTGTKVTADTDKTGTKVTADTDKTGTKVTTTTDKSGTNSGNVTQVTTTPKNTDVTTVPTDINVPVTTTKLNDSNPGKNPPDNGNNPPVIIRCDNIIIVQGTTIVIVNVRLENFNIKSYFQETVIEFNFNSYFSISDIELNYAIKTVNTRYEIIGNEVHLYNIDTTRLSSNDELFKVDINAKNNVPVGKYNMDLNASAKRAVDYTNQDGVKKAVYSDISTVKGGESSIEVKDKSSSVKQIVPKSVKITNPYKKFYYSHVGDKIDTSGLKVTADIITTYDNGEQSTEYGVDITNKISIPNTAVPSKLYNDNAFKYSIDLIYTDAEIAPVGKSVGEFYVLIGELGDVTLDHEVDVVDSTIMLREAAKRIVDMTIMDTVLNESKSKLEYGFYETVGEETIIDFMEFLGNVYNDGETDVVDSTLILRFSALLAVADIKGNPLDRVSAWGKLLTI